MLNFFMEHHDRAADMFTMGAMAGICVGSMASALVFMACGWGSR